MAHQQELTRDRAILRRQAIEKHLPMAHRLARRYTGRGVETDDLGQVAALGLIHAVDRYDPSRQVPLAGYAAPTIVGSLKRHFRDQGWAMRVPRATQELSMRVSGAIDPVGQRHGRTPTAADLAEHLGVPVTDVVTATAAHHAYRLSSLDEIRSGSEAGRSDLASRLGVSDVAYERIDNRLALRSALATLTAPTRHILALRFIDELSQTQIADKIGVSQMHVSRLLKKALTQLRIQLTTG
jgi:RNA polymerase sigma-B factor